jgi:ABC-type branched-subunit amino acid transport system substrate-binding protein
LKVGVAYIDNSQTQEALGVSSDQTANGRSAARAMVRGINDAGGLNGRNLQAVEYAWDTSRNNWSTDATAACEKFTRDEPVSIVLDAAFGTTGGFGECLQKAGVLHITNGPEGDHVSSRQRSLHANTRSMVDDRTYGAVAANLHATRYLTSRNQLGVIVEQCPAIERAYAQSIKPLLARLGLAAPIERFIECTTSLASAGPGGSAVSAAILAFRNAGVDRVMFVSDQESVLLLLFANAASSQQYFPGYALSSSAQAETLRSTDNLPPDQWPQLHGVGTSPSVDVADDGTDPVGVDARCVRLAKRGGLTVQARVDYAFVYGACGLFLLLEAALERTSNGSDPALLQGAINGLGRSFQAPGLVAHSTRYSPTEHDGPNAVRVFGYVEQCTCLRYRGEPLRAPR